MNKLKPFQKYCRYLSSTGEVVGFSVFLNASGPEISEFPMPDDDWEKYKRKHEQNQEEGLGNLFIAEHKGGSYTIRLDDAKTAEVAAAKRKERDDRLHSRELLIFEDSPLSEEKKNEIRRVRKILYDITTTPGFPLSFSWPELNQNIMNK